MRTCPAAERTLLGGPALSHHLKVEVTNDSGTWIDLTTVGGVNWVKQVSITESADQPVASASVSLRAEHGALSLNQLRTDSALNVNDSAAYAPLIYGGRFVRIRVGAGLPDAAVPSTPWREVFYGLIEEPGAIDNGETVTFNARDLGALLLDRFIEHETVYGDPDGVDVEIEMQRILDENTHGAAVSASIELPGGSPNWAIREYLQAAVPVLDAERTLAQQIGWEIRYRYAVDATDANRLALEFYDPDRTKATPDWTLSPSEYLSVEDFRFKDRNIRNVIGLWFFDRTNKGNRRYLEVVDAASVSIFGRRYMQLSEAATSGIDTPVEANRMLNAALADLSTPYADQLLTTYDLWFAQLGDLVSFPANDVLYNGAQEFAIVSLTRTYVDGTAKMQLGTRGKPLGAYADWIRKHGKGPSGRGLPAAYFGQPIGESTEGGGVSGDGAVWQEVRFEPNTLWVDVYVEEREDTPVPVPEVSEITRAWRLYRQKGKLGSNLNWRTFLGMGTRPDFFKRIRAYAYNAAGDAGPEFIADAVQARDVGVIMDGVCSSLTVTSTTEDDGTITTTIAVQVGATDPARFSYLMIMRNGVIIAPVPIGFANNQLYTVVDQELDPAVTYTYEAFIYTDGVTGAHLSTFQTPSGDPTPPSDPTAGTIVWRQTPQLVIYSTRGVFEQYVQCQYAQNITGIAKVALQRSIDGVNGWADVDVKWGTQVAVGVYSAQHFGEFLFQPVTPAFFRFRAATADDATEYFSSVEAWARPSKSPVATGTVQFTNASPRLNPAGTAVALDYISAVPGFHHMVLETGPDSAGPWTDLDSSTAASGQFSDADTDPKWYRLRIENAGNVPLAYGTALYWNGPPVPTTDYPPTIDAGYPRAVLQGGFGGVRVVQVAYSSAISWFARARLQISDDGSNWRAVLSETAPYAPLVSTNASDTFETTYTGAGWYRVRAEDTNNRLALQSAAVYFPGVDANKGAADSTPPTFTLYIEAVPPTNAQRLACAWDCANKDGAVVTLEQSADDGLLDAWVEVGSSAAVVAGTLVPAADFTEETYYRMLVKDAAGTTIATSPSQYWPGHIFQA